MFDRWGFLFLFGFFFFNFFLFGLLFLGFFPGFCLGFGSFFLLFFQPIGFFSLLAGFNLLFGSAALGFCFLLFFNLASLGLCPFQFCPDFFLFGGSFMIFFAVGCFLQHRSVKVAERFSQYPFLNLKVFRKNDTTFDALR